MSKNFHIFDQKLAKFGLSSKPKWLKITQISQ